MSMTNPTADTQTYEVPIHDYANMDDFFGGQPFTLPGEVIGPEYEADIDRVRVTTGDADGDTLVATAIGPDGDETAYEFTVTQAREPALCTYTWNEGDLPTAVTHAVYRAGYAIENVRTFPQYDPQHEKLLAVARVLSVNHQKFDQSFDSPLLADLFGRSLQTVIIAERAVRTRLVLDDDEYETIITHIRQKVGEVTGGETLSMAFEGPPVEFVDLLHDLAQSVVESRDSTVERTIPADKLDDEPTGEFPYRTSVETTDGYQHVLILHEDGGIERFPFKALGDSAYEPVTPHLEVDGPHQAAVNALYREGDEVPGYPNLDQEFGPNMLDQVEDIIATMESVEARFSEMDGSSMTAMACGMATPLLEDVRLTMAYYEELGLERFAEIEAECNYDGKNRHEMWAEFTRTLDEMEPDFLENPSDRLQGVLDDREQKNERGEMIPSYSIGGDQQ